MKFNPQEEKHEIIVVADFEDYAKVPFQIAEKGGASGNAVKLFIVYYRFSFNWRGGDAKKVRRVTQDVIADTLGVTVKTVSTLTSELHRKGWITSKRTGRTNMITLHGKPKRRT